MRIDPLITMTTLSIFNLNLFVCQVSWVRRRDWHILTSNMFTYTNDERFQVVHSEGSDDWDLQIKYVQKRDNGTYECQVKQTTTTTITKTRVYFIF